MEGGEGVRKVTKDEFYQSIGNKDAVPHILPTPYPYTSVFKLRYGGAEMGRIVGRTEGGLTVNDHFLPERQT